MLGLWGTWRLGRLIGGGFVCVVAMLLLALTPMYYGHIYNNPKDIPFACGVVWTLYYMCKTLGAYPQIKTSLLLKLGIVYSLTLGARERHHVSAALGLYADLCRVQVRTP